MVRTKDISATFNPDQWRARARYTRDLAQSALTRATLEKLEEIARGYDRRANELEAVAAPEPPHGTVGMTKA
jgi:hypothetical protein